MISFNYNVPFGHYEDSKNGIVMWIGDKENYKWKLDFPAYFGMPPAPPIVCYVPEWIFERKDEIRTARDKFKYLADLGFVFHIHDKCCNTHNRIIRHGNVVLDLPCC